MSSEREFGGHRDRRDDRGGFGKPFSGQKRPWPGGDGDYRSSQGRHYDKRDGAGPPPNHFNGPGSSYGASGPSSRDYRGPGGYDSHRQPPRARGDYNGPTGSDYRSNSDHRFQGPPSSRHDMRSSAPPHRSPSRDRLPISPRHKDYRNVPPRGGSPGEDRGGSSSRPINGHGSHHRASGGGGGSSHHHRHHHSNGGSSAPYDNQSRDHLEAGEWGSQHLYTSSSRDHNRNEPSWKRGDMLPPPSGYKPRGGGGDDDKHHQEKRRSRDRKSESPASLGEIRDDDDVLDRGKRKRDSIDSKEHIEALNGNNSVKGAAAAEQGTAAIISPSARNGGVGSGRKKTNHHHSSGKSSDAPGSISLADLPHADSIEQQIAVSPSTTGEGKDVTKNGSVPPGSISASEAVLRRIQEVDDEMSALEIKVKDMAAASKRYELAEGKAAKALAKVEEVPAPQPPPALADVDISDVPLSSDDEDEEQNGGEEDEMEARGAGEDGGKPKRRGRPPKNAKRGTGGGADQKAGHQTAFGGGPDASSKSMRLAKSCPVTHKSTLAALLGRQVAAWSQWSPDELLQQAKTTAIESHRRFNRLLRDELLEPAVISTGADAMEVVDARVKMEESVYGGIDTNTIVPPPEEDAAIVVEVLVPKATGAPEEIAAAMQRLAIMPPTPVGISKVLRQEFTAMLSRHVLSAVDYRIRYEKYRKALMIRQQSAENLSSMRRSTSSSREQHQQPMTPTAGVGPGRSTSRGRNADVVRSDYEEKQAIATLALMELVKKMLELPTMQLPSPRAARWVSQYQDYNRLIEDPVAEEERRQLVRPFTEEERNIFAEKFLLHHKEFHKIVPALPGRSFQEVVALFYAIQKSEEFDQTRRKYSMRKRREKADAAANQRNQGLRGLGIAAYQPPQAAVLADDGSDELVLHHNHHGQQRKTSSATHGSQQQLSGGDARAAAGTTGGLAKGGRSKSSGQLVNPEPPTAATHGKRSVGRRRRASPALLEARTSVLPSLEEFAVLPVAGSAPAALAGGSRFQDEDMEYAAPLEPTTAIVSGKGSGRGRKPRPIDPIFDVAFCEAVRACGQDVNAISRHLNGVKTPAAVRLYFNRHAVRLQLHTLVAEHAATTTMEVNYEDMEMSLEAGSADMVAGGGGLAVLQDSVMTHWSGVNNALTALLLQTAQQQAPQVVEEGGVAIQNTNSGDLINSIKAVLEAVSGVAVDERHRLLPFIDSLAQIPVPTGDNNQENPAVDAARVQVLRNMVLDPNAVLTVVVGPNNDNTSIANTTTTEGGGDVVVVVPESSSNNNVALIEALRDVMPFLAMTLHQLAVTSTLLSAPSTATTMTTTGTTMTTRGGAGNGGKGKRATASYWMEEEKAAFIECFKNHGRDWTQLEAAVPTKSATQIKNFYQNYRQKLGLAKMNVPQVTGQRGRKRKAVVGGGGGVNDQLTLAAEGTTHGDGIVMPPEQLLAYQQALQVQHMQQFAAQALTAGMMAAAGNGALEQQQQQPADAVQVTHSGGDEDLQQQQQAMVTDTDPTVVVVTPLEPPSTAAVLDESGAQPAIDNSQEGAPSQEQVQQQQDLDKPTAAGDEQNVGGNSEQTAAAVAMDVTVAAAAEGGVPEDAIAGTEDNNA